ncbi:MAG TPA: adenosylcobinamide-GDP ribazoletransferase [Solirubrobacterales bacterium]|nr:adenosylcobinamide-GDP ribazoletransferase [Solirubrobacterales bacterium]
MPRPEPGSLAVAGAFLTRLPLRRGAGADGEALARAVSLFPLVGAGLGAVVGGVAIGLSGVLPPLIAGLLAVALELVLTGAIHADGLADGADGLGGRDRKRSLAIMRDHTLGSYGAAALFLDLAVKAVALGHLGEAGALGAVVAALALSRAAPLPLGWLLPYARPGAGSGRLLAGRIGAASAAVGTALALLVAGVAAGLPTLVLFAAVAVATALVGSLSRRRLGGVTGDVLGAAIELSATAALVVAVALETPA